MSMNPLSLICRSLVSLSLCLCPSIFLYLPLSLICRSRSLSLCLTLSLSHSPSLFRSLGLGNGRLPSKCYRVMGDSLKFPTEFMHLLSAFLFSPHKEETMLHGKEDLGCACNRTVTKEELNYTRS